MIIAVVGAGGKTSLIKEMSMRYVQEGKTVFITTTTHMFIEDNTLCTDDAKEILFHLKENRIVMAGIAEGKKIKSLSKETYEEVCKHADVVLVEADGSKHMPLKYPNDTEPVIPENADKILIVCGLHGLGKKAKECCHRIDLVKKHLKIEDDTIIKLKHVRQLLELGYLKPLKKQYPEKQVSVAVRHDGSLYQRMIAAVLKKELYNLIRLC